MKILNRNFSRREILKKSTDPGIGLKPAQLGHISPKFLHIEPRYHRWHVDPGVDWLETNTGYDYLEWSIPLPHTALVLVDVWQRHYLKDTEERGEAVINKKLVPMLASCRQSGMNIIHAPSPGVAKQHPNWVKLIKDEELVGPRDDWPPEQFRNLSGPYQTYQRPFEPREIERQNLPALTFHPKVIPMPNEPVVATGEELHRYCKNQNILFLIFAGFNTNACILSRDYGTVQMSNRGYQVVLVRDCTTGMESAQTQATLGQTKGAILLLEMFGQYSVLSDEIISGFTPNPKSI